MINFEECVKSCQNSLSESIMNFFCEINSLFISNCDHQNSLRLKYLILELTGKFFKLDSVYCEDKKKLLQFYSAQILDSFSCVFDLVKKSTVVNILENNFKKYFDCTFESALNDSKKRFLYYENNVIYIGHLFLKKNISKGTLNFLQQSCEYYSQLKNICVENFSIFSEEIFQDILKFTNFLRDNSKHILVAESNDLKLFYTILEASCKSECFDLEYEFNQDDIYSYENSSPSKRAIILSIKQIEEIEELNYVIRFLSNGRDSLKYSEMYYVINNQSLES